MDKREYAEKLYAALEPMAHAGRVEDAWGGELLSEFDDLLQCELYPDEKDEPEWVFMFIQLYFWQFASYHEGVHTYYSNFYQVDTENSIQRLSDCLYQYGFMEVAKWYDYGILNYHLYPEFDYPAENGLRMGETDEWIQDNPEVIWQVYLKLLQQHKEEVLETAGNWVLTVRKRHRRKTMSQRRKYSKPRYSRRKFTLCVLLTLLQRTVR